jgi:hypothetical protein
VTSSEAIVPGIEDPNTALSAVGLLNAYVPIFAIAFLTSLLATPLVRRFAVAQGIVDRPDAVRKLHAFPIAYLGGVSPTTSGASIPDSRSPGNSSPRRRWRFRTSGSASRRDCWPP